MLERWNLPGRTDLGALRLRLVGLKNLHPSELPQLAEQNGADPHPNLVLDLDYTVLMPRRQQNRAGGGNSADGLPQDRSAASAV